MMDVVDSATRSWMMSNIRSKDTEPEMLVRRFLHLRGFRYRIHDRKLPGRPDIVFSRKRIAIFVHGCFWHQHHSCRFATTPGSNQEKWAAKFRANMERDKKNLQQLRQDGWNVIVIWECGLSKKSVSEDLCWLPQAINFPVTPLLEWPAKK